MFTAENFRRIFDKENRKGIDLATRFFPGLEPHTKAIRDKVEDIRALRSEKSTLKPELYVEMETKLKAKLADLKSIKSSAVDKELEDVSSKVLQPAFKFVLKQKKGPKGKPVFCVDDSPETFFVIKQLQQNLNKLYGVKQSNRHELVCQVRDTLLGGFPYELVRTDISAFYESIDRKQLLEKLDQDQLLSPSSKEYIKQVLDSYGKVTGTTTGIPRGVGISAYLAEFYLRAVDYKIRRIPGLVLYCRYVDDIVAIFASPPAGRTNDPYIKLISNVLAASGLTHNIAKTDCFDIGVGGKIKFEYLGYRFRLNERRCEISPSAAKVMKYKKRLIAAFSAYEAECSVRSRKAYRELVSRVKFLTGNTRLSNSKSTAVTGVYYNNSIVNVSSAFLRLDKILRLKINQTRRPNLKKRLKKI